MFPGGNSREGRYVQGTGMSRGGGAVGSMFRGGGMPWDLGCPPSPVLTPSDSDQNTYGWQAGGTHPTEMLSCYVTPRLPSEFHWIHIAI